MQAVQENISDAKGVEVVLDCLGGGDNTSNDAQSGYLEEKRTERPEKGA